MKMRCRVRGTLEIGDNVRLTLEPSEAVQEKEEMGTMKILSNPMGLMNKMKTDAIMQGQPDIITIPKEEWEKHKWQIDDIVVIEIKPE